jgi:membrane protease YdiL (CAAX protease family)
MSEGKQLAGGFGWSDASSLTKAQHRSRTWAVVLPATVLPLFGALLYFVIAKGVGLAQLAYSGTKLFTLVWPLIAVPWILKHRIERPAWREARHWRTLPLGLLVGAGIVGLMFLLMQTEWLGSPVRANADRINDTITGLGLNRANYWAFGICLAVLHSLLEEYYWRWFVFGGLRQLMPAGLAHALAGAAFMGHHVVVVLQFFPVPLALFLSFSIGLGGVIWSGMYVRQGSLLGVWLCHIIVDFGILTIGYQLLFGTASAVN